MYKKKSLHKPHGPRHIMALMLMCVFAFSLSGCSMVEPLWQQNAPAQAADAPDNSVRVSQHGQKVTSIDALAPQAHITCTNPATGQAFNAIVAHTYYSALGVECAKINIQGTDAAYRPAALCKMEEGHWELFYSSDNLTRRTAAP